MSDARTPPQPPSTPAGTILRVRAGHGANCSSIGSVIDTLFATAVVGSAIFAAVAASLAAEDARVVEGEAKKSIDDEAEGDR